MSARLEVAVATLQELNWRSTQKNAVSMFVVQLRALRTYTRKGGSTLRRLACLPGRHRLRCRPRSCQATERARQLLVPQGARGQQFEHYVRQVGDALRCWKDGAVLADRQ